ncbi:hypothetical protein QP028_02765 [Corynebacterium suedekumii]|nr:hypothetical protein QP028_02765 [Corynebacterium suedekumii]
MTTLHSRSSRDRHLRHPHPRSMSAAHASSFGSSSNGTAVAPVDPPKQPVEETPAPVDTDAQVAEKFRAAFVEAFENSGGVENAAATKVAQDVAEEAAAGELLFVQADADGLYYTHEDPVPGRVPVRDRRVPGGQEPREPRGGLP